MMQRISFTAILLLASIALQTAHAESPWPQFRGPNGSGIAEDQKPPVEFGPDKNVKWKVPVPSGFSSPIVVGDKLVLTAFDDGKLYTIAYNRADGKEVWRKEAPAKEIEKFHRTEGSPAASTPCTDGKKIVSYFGSCGLVCYDLAGKELWNYPMPTAITPGNFGSGVSPVMADGVVVLLRDEFKEPQIVAVDVATGKQKWKMPRSSRSGYSTPTVWETPGGKQVVTPGYGQMIGYNLSDGKEAWTVPGMPAACCTTPTIADGLLLFAGWSPGDTETEDPEMKMPSFDEQLKAFDKNKDGEISKEETAGTPVADFFDGMDFDKDGKMTKSDADAMKKFLSASKNSAFALKAGGRGDLTKSHVLWKKNKGLPYVPSAIAYQGQYLMVKDGGIVTAYDTQTGKDIFGSKRVAPGKYYASPVAADGNIYLTSLEDGTVTVLKGGAAQPEVVAKNPPLGERVAATPAIADNTIYIRTAGHLYAFAEQK
jgi:outer membrane protein assembly factor BamB